MTLQIGRRHAVRAWAWTIAAVVTTLVWVSSGWWEMMTPSVGQHALGFDQGRFEYVQCPDCSSDISPAITWSVGRSFEKPGFALRMWYDHFDWSEIAVWYVPAWPIPLAFSLIAALHWRRAIIAALHPLTIPCPHCRYDLRATPQNSPCPECGHRP